ncbi:HD family phosphohydrolase [Myxosarcina sp. GI1(2024)]
MIILLFSVITLTSVVGYRFYNQPQLTIGKISPVTIKAPEDGQFEDTQTTIHKRQKVQTGIVPILKQNRGVTDEVIERLELSIDNLEKLRQLTAPFPFVETTILSLPSQRYLRSCSEAEFKAILASVELPQNPSKSKSLQYAREDFNLRAQQVTVELLEYRQQGSPEEYQALVTQITLNRYRYSQGWKQIEREPGVSLNSQQITTLLDLSDRSWKITKLAILQAAERILIQGIPPGMPSNLLEKTVAVQLSSDIPESTLHFASNLLLNTLEPNLEKDREATRNIAEKAARAIEPVIVKINAGEIIVKKGEKISQADFVLLDGFGLSRRGTNWDALRETGIFVTLIVCLFLSLQKRIYTSMRCRDYLLICLMSLSTLLLSVLNIEYTNLPAIGFLVSSFYNPGLAVGHVSLLTVLVLFGNPAIPWQYLLAGSAGGLLAAVFAGRSRSREAMARLGVLVGLLQGSVCFVSNLILSSSAAAIWSAVLPGALIYGLSGLAWSIIAIGISPYLERYFDIITPIRLAELSNPNLPLLKRLATETPGTFQHTMFVASLAEAAARELNCNVELVRAGTLYHDIGKMHDPLGFIENQLGGVNKHDEIDDPYFSAIIIKKHVSEGLKMARRYGLPKAIRDFIPEHQGTLLIAYFYYQAKAKAEREGTTVSESDFRYAGPIPQTREAGIMMLADGCEAALRSLKEATTQQALSTIKKIFKARWQDRQLVDSGLSYEELPIIAEVFIRVWQQYNHKRIAYPKGALDSKR